MSSVNQVVSPQGVLTTQTYSVRLPLESKKRYSVLKFNAANNVDFTKCGVAKIERENNLKDFKNAYDIETVPKFGAGSEFGREQREEARKKKFGVNIKKYNSDEQPWLLKLGGGAGKPPRRFKGIREGGVAENASFFIFMQCSDGKTFEAIPLDEWYNFTPQVKYKYLDTDEAEEEFSRRDKTLNYFNIMLRKRLKNDENPEEAGDPEEGETGKRKSKKTDKSLVLSEFDEWSHSSDDDDEEEEDGDKDGEGKTKQKKKVKPSERQKKKKKTEGSDEEAVEESDEADEGEEVDYMSGSSSDDEQMYDDKARGDSDKYQDKGVEDEEGLRKLVDSGDEDEEEEKKDEENEEDEDMRLREDKPKDSNSESSSDSDSDSDPEKDTNFASALFMTQEKRQPVKQEPTNSRPSTPSSITNSDVGNKVKKRKAETQSPLTVPKKIKSETSLAGPTTSSASLPALTATISTEGITEEAVRRYLMRKPMTTKDLVTKFKSRNAGMSKDQMTTTIAHILKRINPQKKMIKDKMYLFIEKPS